MERPGGTPARWLGAHDRVGNRVSEQIDDSVSQSIYNEKNQLLGRSTGGALRWRGTLNEPGNVTFRSALVDGKPARMLSGNTFEVLLDVAEGMNTVTVQATDVSGNTTTKQYQVNLTATGASYTYDANGNLATKSEGTSAWTYTWDAENRLTQVAANGSTVALFAYDPLGRRVQKLAAGVTTKWTSDGSAILRQTGGSATVKFVQGSGIDEPLAIDDGTALSYYHADSLGSIVKTTNATGAVSFTRRTDVWGNPQVGGATAGYAFTGREWEPETALYYYRARFYDPEIGRFISEDPLRFRGGENFYLYVDDDPANFADPSGRVKVHGNWCGPNWTGGHKESYSHEHGSYRSLAGPYYDPPVDAEDAVCEKHDQCYAVCRDNYSCDQGSRRDCMAICDWGLVIQMPPTVTGTTIATGIALHPPDPETNKACGCKQPAAPAPPAPSNPGPSKPPNPYCATASDGKTYCWSPI